MLLSEKERNVSELCADLGTQSQPAVSHHLALLRHGRLIEPRRSGKHNFYALTDAGRELAQVVDYASSADTVAPALDAMASRLTCDRGVARLASAVDPRLVRRQDPAVAQVSPQALAEVAPGRGRRRAAGRPGRRPRAR